MIPTTNTGPLARRKEATMAITTAELRSITDPAEFLARAQEQFDAAWPALVARAQVRGLDRLEPIGTGSGVDMVVAVATYEPGTEVEAIVAGTAVPSEVLCTQDGRPAHLVWHEGDPTGDSIFVERWTAEGRTFHGYVDPTSRRLVQVG